MATRKELEKEIQKLEKKINSLCCQLAEAQAAQGNSLVWEW